MHVPADYSEACSEVLSYFDFCTTFRNRTVPVLASIYTCQMMWGKGSHCRIKRSRETEAPSTTSAYIPFYPRCCSDIICSRIPPTHPRSHSYSVLQSLPVLCKHVDSSRDVSAQADSPAGDHAYSRYYVSLVRAHMQASLEI
jgi:hypothetical protein